MQFDHRCRPKSVTLAAPLSPTKPLRNLAVRRTTTLSMLLASALCLGACQRAPDAAYLHDYAQAHDLLDAYNGSSD